MTSARPSPERLLRALMDICGPHSARAAGPADTVAGRRAGFVAAPATAGGVVDILHLAAEHDLALLTRGAGTKIDWGVPPARLDVLLDTGRLSGVWHHRPDELTAEVGAGTTVAAVQAALALRGQRLALDPPSAGATVGGVLAVNESGPLRHRFGSPDEQVHEYQHVDPGGSPGQAAGGASRRDDDRPDEMDDGPPPGVLISARVRLQPLPAARRWVSRPASTPLQVHNFVADTLNADVSPSAIEVDLPAPGLPGPAEQRPGAVAALLEGDPASVRERAEQLAAALGDGTSSADTAPAWWGTYPFGAQDVALRLTVAIADLHSVVYALRDVAGGAVPVRGSAGLGTVHAVLSGQLAPQRVEQILEAVRGVLLGRGGRCVIVAAPVPISTVVDMAARADLI